MLHLGCRAAEDPTETLHKNAAELTQYAFSGHSHWQRAASGTQVIGTRLRVPPCIFVQNLETRAESGRNFENSRSYFPDSDEFVSSGSRAEGNNRKVDRNIGDRKM